jgi:hypothetical protein
MDPLAVLAHGTDGVGHERNAEKAQSEERSGLVAVVATSGVLLLFPVPRQGAGKPRRVAIRMGEKTVWTRCPAMTRG